MGGGPRLAIHQVEAPLWKWCPFTRFSFDAMPYLDMLLRNPGVGTRRNGTFVKELFDPYGRRDYVVLISEWN